MKDGELERSHKLLQCLINIVFTFKGKECWSHEKHVWQSIKAQATKKGGSRILQYWQKHIQTDLYKNLDAGGQLWLRFYMDPKKASAIINTQEKIIEIGMWEKKGGIYIDLDKCWLCRKCVERATHLTSDCQMFASNKYLKWHNSVLTVLAITWAVEKNLLEKS